tara:strand:+ start:261 stop:428 length:168 start_codon:yes stop_codon:yes gene_type:complete
MAKEGTGALAFLLACIILLFALVALECYHRRRRRKGQKYQSLAERDFDAENDGDW